MNHRPARLLTLVLLGLLVALGPASITGPAIAKGAPLTLYLTDFSGDAGFTPLDPMTLADDASAEPLKFKGDYPEWAVSADGSTMVVVEFSTTMQPTLRRLDPETRAELASFELPRDLYGPLLNRDGSLVVLRLAQSGGVSGVTKPEWRVFSTKDGSPVASILGEGQGINPFGFHDAMLDPGGERLYVPFVPGEQNTDEPLPMQIAAYDLRTGQEVGRIELPEVMAGSWFPTDGSDELGVVNEAISPAVTLSPNGGQLAVVDALTGRITLIHASSMTVDRSFLQEHQLSWRDRVGRWLSFGPESADAKLMEGRVFKASYSADGWSLFVSGRTVEIGDSLDEIEAEALGIQRIDIRSGKVKASGLQGVDVLQVWIAPEGQSLYVLGYDQPWETATNGVAPMLRRLNAETLEVEAERELPMSAQVIAAPVGL
jgi:hypothetical protein